MQAADKRGNYEKISFSADCCSSFSALAGCRIVRIEEEDRKPVAYTVVEHSDIPEELSRIIREKKRKKNFS